jgi:hypothetical protein
MTDADVDPIGVAPGDVRAGGGVTSRLEDGTTTGGGPGLVRQPQPIAKAEA